MPRSMTSGSRVPRNTSRSKPFRTAVTAEPKRATNLSTTASSSRWQGWVAPPKYPEKWRRLYFGLRASARAKVYSIMSIDHWLEAPGLDDDTRRDLEKARKQALAGELTEADFRKLRVRALGETPPLRALVSSLRVARKRTRAIPSLPVTVLTDLDALIARIQAMGDVTEQVAKLVGSRRAP